MGRKSLSKKQVKVINILGIVFLFFGFTAIVICGLMKRMGYGGDSASMLGACTFSICFLIAVVLSFVTYGDTMVYKLEKKRDKLLAMELNKIQGISKENLKEAFLRRSFKERDDGYIKGKVFSPIKGFIHYYVKAVNAVDLESDIDKEFAKFMEIGEKRKNTCLILFLYKNEILDRDLELLRQVDTHIIIVENAQQNETQHSGIVILVDSCTEAGYFLNGNSKFCTSIYAHSCRVLNKVLVDS